MEWKVPIGKDINTSSNTIHGEYMSTNAVSPSSGTRILVSPNRKQPSSPQFKEDEKISNFIQCTICSQTKNQEDVKKFIHKISSRCQVLTNICTNCLTD